MKPNHFYSLPVNLTLSLATFPFVLGCLTFSYCTQTLVELGQISEEALRGIRLPVLNFSDLQNWSES